MARAADRPVTLGLRANAGQFTLLVLVNALVGAMSSCRSWARTCSG